MAANTPLQTAEPQAVRLLTMGNNFILVERHPTQQAVTELMNLKICALGVLILLAIGQQPVAKVAYLLNGKIWVKELPDGVPRQMSEASAEFPKWSPSGKCLSYRQSATGTSLGRNLETHSSQSTFIVASAEGGSATAVKLGSGEFEWSPTRDELASWIMWA